MLLHIHVPDAITDSTEEITEIVKGVLKDRAEYLEKKEWEKRLLADKKTLSDYFRDKYFNRWCDEIKKGWMTTPLVTAETYRYIPSRQEVIGYDDPFRKSPVRPVFMRGAMEIIISRHALSASENANGWALLIIERYLRITKYTSFDREESLKKIDSLRRAMSKRYSLTYHINDHLIELYVDYRDAFNRIWLFGKRIYVTDHQFSYLKKLHGIIKKFDKIEDRFFTLMNHGKQLDA